MPMTHTNAYFAGPKRKADGKFRRPSERTRQRTLQTIATMNVALDGIICNLAKLLGTPISETERLMHTARSCKTFTDQLQADACREQLETVVCQAQEPAGQTKAQAELLHAEFTALTHRNNASEITEQIYCSALFIAVLLLCTSLMILHVHCSENSRLTSNTTAARLAAEVQVISDCLHWCFLSGNPCDADFCGSRLAAKSSDLTLKLCFVTPYCPYNPVYFSLFRSVLR